MKRFLAACLIVLAAPAAAHASDVSMTVRDVPLGARSLQSVSGPPSFDMLAVHWRGKGSVSFRTRSADGRWSAWQIADADTGPDPGSPESHPGWNDGTLAWVGPSTQAAFRTSGKVRALKAYYVSSKPRRTTARTLAVAGSPAIVARSAWAADTKIVTTKPALSPTIRLAIVHHTASTNAYTPAQSAAIVRGIQLYHVQGNHWNDIGYNFLVDRFGTIYEGRGGGIEQNVIGAHSLGFNKDTVGIALIGDFDGAAPTDAMRQALVKLLAWRLDVAHLDPLATTTYVSGGNLKFARGTKVTLAVISGHRDTYLTDCPGKEMSTLLPAVAQEVAATGLPKLYAPTVTGTLGGPVHFRATLSSAIPWSITVTNTAGTVVGHNAGTSSTIDWTWNATGVTGKVTWVIDGGPSLKSATGTLGSGSSAPVELLTSVTVAPTTITPMTPATTSTVIQFALSIPANVSILVYPDAGSKPVASLFAGALPAGPQSVQRDLSVLATGRYRLVLTASPAGGVPVSRSQSIVVDRTISALTVSAPLISPNGDGYLDATQFTFALERTVPIQVSIQRAGAIVATVYTGELGPGAQALVWLGTANGASLPDGEYQVVVTEIDPYGSVSAIGTFISDTTGPTLTLIDPSTLTFTLSEPASVTVVVNGQTLVQSEPAGTFRFPYAGPPPTSISASARDAAGNTGPPVTSP
ncbi:MAG: hypothetical protein F2663_00560 [Actinobacteria bacterium]|nr:hypothetical protein [Actinomycetota bacterium]